MKTVSAVETSIVEKPRPLKVCMHLVESARTDFRVMRDAKALAEAGFEVTIIDIERSHSLATKEEINGINVKNIIMPEAFIEARFKPYFFIKMIMMIARGVIQLLRTEADVYHAHVEKALPACYIVSCLRRKPLIFDAPDLTLSDPSIMRWRKLRSLAIRFLAYMVPHCAAVITASPYYISELRALYQASTVTVIRNTPVYQVVPRSDRLHKYLKLCPEVRIALYQGNIQANRGLDRLVHAAKFLEPDTVIVIMGNGVEPVHSQLNELIISEQVMDRVKLLPSVPYDELLDWTASADIGLAIFPPDYSLSIRFTLPNKLFEYLMAGLPVLSSRLDAIAEIIETRDVGKVLSSSAPSDIGTAINRMLSDASGLARMRDNALRAARCDFRWENDRLKLIQLYHAILIK